LVASLAAAQIGPPPVRQTPVKHDSVWAAALARLTPRNTIRVHQLASASGTTLALVGTPAPVEYPFATLDSLWVRGKRTKTGAIIGSISFAVAGLAYGYLANEVGCKDDGADPCP
jgi:hypothetical protein